MVKAWWDWDQRTVYVSQTDVPEDREILWKWARLQRTKPVAWLTVVAAGALWLSVAVTVLVAPPADSLHVATAAVATLVAVAAGAWLHRLRPANQPGSILSATHRPDNAAVSGMLDAFAAVDDAALRGELTEAEHEEARQQVVHLLFDSCPLPAEDGRRYRHTNEWLVRAAPSVLRTLRSAP